MLCSTRHRQGNVFQHWHHVCATQCLRVGSLQCKYKLERWKKYVTYHLLRTGLIYCVHMSSPDVFSIVICALFQVYYSVSPPGSLWIVPGVPYRCMLPVHIFTQVAHSRVWPAEVLLLSKGYPLIVKSVRDVVETLKQEGILRWDMMVLCMGLQRCFRNDTLKQVFCYRMYDDCTWRFIITVTFTSWGGMALGMNVLIMVYNFQQIKLLLRSSGLPPQCRIIQCARVATGSALSSSWGCHVLPFMYLAPNPICATAFFSVFAACQVSFWPVISFWKSLIYLLMAVFQSWLWTATDKLCLSRSWHSISVSSFLWSMTDMVVILRHMLYECMSSFSNAHNTYALRILPPRISSISHYIYTLPAVIIFIHFIVKLHGSLSKILIFSWQSTFVNNEVIPPLLVRYFAYPNPSANLLQWTSSIPLHTRPCFTSVTEQISVIWQLW